MQCKLVLLMQLSPMTTNKFLILSELCHSMFPKVLKSVIIYKFAIHKKQQILQIYVQRNGRSEKLFNGSLAMHQPGHLCSTKTKIASLGQKWPEAESG